MVHSVEKHCWYQGVPLLHSQVDLPEVFAVLASPESLSSPAPSRKRASKFHLFLVLGQELGKMASKVPLYHALGKELHLQAPQF